jgi:uncharacterized protein
MLMEEIRLQLDESGRGAFHAREGEDQLGEMTLRISGDELTVFHTGVSPKAEGRGLAKKMLGAMTDYARSHGLKVIPLCPFVHAQFQRHPDQYEDIWKKSGREQAE